MMTKQKQTLFAILGGLLLMAGLVTEAYAQQAGPEVPGPLRTLTGRVRWKKELGVLPRAPGAREPAENICAQFFVVAVRAGGETAAYDNTLEAKPEIGKPDHYSCLFDMQVPSNVYLAVHPGMGDALAWPKTEKTPFHYTAAWIDSGRPTRYRARRAFTPINRVVSLSKKGMYLSFELVTEQ